MVEIRKFEVLPFSSFEVDGLPLENILPDITVDVERLVETKLLIEQPSVIKDRLENRDRTLWDIDLIDNFQETEIKRVQQFSMEKNIPLLEINDGVQIEEVLEFLKPKVLIFVSVT